MDKLPVQVCINFVIETRIPNILTDWDVECSKGTRIADSGGFMNFLFPSLLATLAICIQ